MTDKYVVITRPLEDQQLFSKKIQKIGLTIFSYPTIKISSNSLSTADQKKILENNFDWVIFTSKNGVIFFIEILKKLKINDFFWNSKKIAAVGPETSKMAKKYDLQVDFTPSQFTTENLASELPNPDGQNILLPRADIASDILTKLLTKRGANVTNIPIYKTKFITKPNQDFLALLKNNQISCITFTSPSTIEGFMKSLSSDAITLVKSIQALVIGPVTAAAAEKYGFKSVIMAEEFTTEGILKKLHQMV